MDSLLFTLLLAPLVLAVVMSALGARFGAKVGWIALVAPVASFIAAFRLWSSPATDRAVAVTYEWAPILGANLSFLTDGLGLLYALIVSGVGVLVVVYAACYLDDRHYRDHGKFYCYLLLFMGAMLATVLSSNLLALFVAWELTGLTSFLLIGFLHEKEESRRGARMALLTTGVTGLALLVGVVLLGVAYGTYEITEIVAGAPRPGSEGMLVAAFLCCFVGIAGKSAQFPFHYWLPNAMAAPTPVSAYLHSATMVKLGVFLTARLLPIFNDLELWTPLLTTVGFGTLLLGAVFALLSQDLKGVLAYTTVAQLGLLIGYYGLHARGVLVAWDTLHILNHVFYKACLFMVVGIIDHSTGTRDLRRLGGLAKKMPLVALAAAIGLAALAGLPPTTGFLSKELLLAGLLDFWREHGGFVAGWSLGCVLLASVVKMAVAVRVWRRAFAGRPSEAVEAHYHAPSPGLQLPPLLLAACALGGGLMAATFGEFATSFGVPGTHLPAPGTLHLWHGVTTELLLSVAIVALGLALYFGVGERRWGVAKIPGLLRLDARFDPLVEGVPLAGKALNKRLGFDNPHAFLLIVGAAGLTLFAGVLLPQSARLGEIAREWNFLPAAGVGWWRWGLVVVVGAAALAAAVWKQPIRQVCALSVVGLGVTVFFVLYSAPDLALTQLLVETATLLLVLLVVLRLKRDDADRQPLPPQRGWMRGLRVVLAAGFGLMLGGGVLIFQRPADVERAGEFYLEQTVPLAKGSNAVNTILVDFRGFDTLLEISVLLIAALGCLGLLYRSRTVAGQGMRVDPAESGELHPVPRDLILRQIALWAFWPLNLVAVHLFLRGHQAPGGGFIAGLVTALSLLLLVFVLGVQGVRRLVRLNPLSLAASGVVLSVLTALLPVALGKPLFYHYHGYIMGFYIGTPFWFDLGVYLTVIGVLLKLILPLMKSIHGLPAFVREDAGRFAARAGEPIDLAPIAGTRGGSPKEGIR